MSAVLTPGLFLPLPGPLPASVHKAGGTGPQVRPMAMAFTDLLDALGGMGRFQLIHMALLLLPCGLLACHNFLQNFTAAVPPHHCRGPANNTEASTNDSGAWLRATIPLDQLGAPEPCRHFTKPQWALLSPNSSIPGAATEGCKDGWVYNRSVFPSTIVMEVRRGWCVGGLLPRPSLKCPCLPCSGIWCVRPALSETWRSLSTWPGCWWGLPCLAAWQTGEPVGIRAPGTQCGPESLGLCIHFSLLQLICAF